jgi:hypothetical protein
MIDRQVPVDRTRALPAAYRGNHSVGGVAGMCGEPPEVTSMPPILSETYHMRASPLAPVPGVAAARTSLPPVPQTMAHLDAPPEGKEHR